MLETHRVLRTTFLALDVDARRYVCQTDGRLGLVDVLLSVEMEQRWLISV